MPPGPSATTSSSPPITDTFWKNRYLARVSAKSKHAGARLALAVDELLVGDHPEGVVDEDLQHNQERQGDGRHLGLEAHHHQQDEDCVRE